MVDELHKEWNKIGMLWQENKHLPFYLYHCASDYQFVKVFFNHLHLMLWNICEKC